MNSVTGILQGFCLLFMNTYFKEYLPIAAPEIIVIVFLCNTFHKKTLYNIPVGISSLKKSCIFASEKELKVLKLTFLLLCIEEKQL